MILKSARIRHRNRIPTLALILVFSGTLTALPAAALQLVGPGVQPDATKTDKDKEKKDKTAGPEHNVTLLEEPGANDLFNRAKKARAKAEKDAEAWPECVKCYADILKKYPAGVYLEKWEGPENTEPAYKNGLYRSVRERVAAELATLPPAAMAVYRVINNPAARVVFLEGQEQFDERKMEAAARDFFLTSWGDNALAWLGESAYERGAGRETVTKLKRAVERPGDLTTVNGLLTRQLLAEIKLGDKAAAEKTLAALSGSMNDAQKGALRVGHDEGAAAFEKLKARVEGLKGDAGTAAKNNLEEDSARWETYFGNSAHNKNAQPRQGAGLRTWSARIDDLLYGRGVVAKEKPEPAQNQDGMGVVDPSMNQQLTISNGYFYINDGQVYAAYPVSEPKPGALAAQGNALFQLPAEGVKSPPTKKTSSARRGDFSAPTPIIQHPYFATLANGRAYGVLGVESSPAGPIDRMNGVRFFRGRVGVQGEEEQKGPSNYLVCFGKKDNAAETSMLWSIKPGEMAFNAQSKADQDWLKGAYFVSAPTYESGTLFAMAVQISATTLDAFGTAFDANTGRLLWKTQICSGQPVVFGVRVQPDRGLPVAVAGRTVYVVTNIGAVAALDAGSGAVKWIRVYDRVKTSQNNMWGVGEMCQNKDFWAPNPPLVQDNVVIVTPQDSEMAYAYDVESGARVWEISRYGGEKHSPDDRGLKHLLGVVDGTAVFTGENIRFVRVKNGHRSPEPYFPESPIRGRGALTSSQILVSTDKGLLSIALQKGAPLALGKMDVFPWTEPKEEAGSVYSADGTIYTVSHSHVNAYIVWQELESKLKEQIAARPDDPEPHVKLSGVYKSIERFDASLGEIDAALAAASKIADETKKAAKVAELKAKRFDALLTLGGSLAAANKTAEALARYKEAGALAAEPGMAPVQGVVALQAQADLLEKSGDLPAAAQTYQEMLDKHTGVVYQFQPQSALKAGLHARTRLNVLISKDAKSYAAIDARAKAALGEAGSDAAKLAGVIARYPNSVHAGTALLILARAELAKTPDRARLSATRYLNQHYATPASNAGTAEALAILAAACERINLAYSAREALLKLSNAEFKDAKLALDNIDAKAAPGTTGSAAEWAQKRLQEPGFKKPLGQSVFSMEKLDTKVAWTKQSPDNSPVFPLFPEGVPPVEMRRVLFSVEGGNEIMALNGRDGREIWKPRPAAPQNTAGKAFWHERLLIVSGEKSVVAYDTADNGVVAWKIDLNLDSSPNGIEWCALAGGRVLVFHSTNVLESFDASSGGSLWRVQIESAPLAYPPACGENFIALTGANSNKLSVRDLDTGVERWSAPLDSASAAPIAFEERVYAAAAKKILAFDARTGKRVCDDIAAQDDVKAMMAAGDTVFALLGRKEVAAFRIDAKNPGKVWSVSGSSDSNSNLYNISEFLVDGDELLIAGVMAQSKAELASYSIRREGTLNWKRDIAIPKFDRRPQTDDPNVFNGAVVVANGQRLVMNANGQFVPQAPAAKTSVLDTPPNWLRENAAREHILLMESPWDAGSVARVATLIDRVTGRAEWYVDLKSEQISDPNRRPRTQLFEGGVVLIEARGRTAYAASNAASAEDDYKELAARVAKNPADVEAKLKLVTADFDRGQKDKALGALIEMLGGATLDAKQFAATYAQYAQLRNDAAAANHGTISFQRVDKEPDLKGGTAGWEGVKEQAFGGLKDIYQASEDKSVRTLPKKEAWRGGDDLSAVFKGAYDASNVYIQVVVTDDKHVNTQTEAPRIEFGDALTLAFDIGLSGGTGWRGDSFQIAFGLGKEGKALGVRRVERGKFTRPVALLEKNFSVTRSEEKKTTVYQIALPLNYLGLAADSNKPFGFTFAVRDQDAGTEVEKSLCSSPGQAGSVDLRVFSRGVLEQKK